MRRLFLAVVLLAAACGTDSAVGFDAGAPLDSTTSTAAPTTSTSTTTTSTTTTSTTTVVAGRETAESVSVIGEPLPRFGEVPDPAAGLVAPVVAGTDFQGGEVEIAPSDTFKVVMVLAHWCPHCRDEVEELGPYFATSPPPANVEVLTVSTGVSPDRPNYPPSQWLTPAAWPVPVLVDTADGAVGAAFGVNAYPFWVVLDPNGVVLARTAGSLPLESVEALFANLAALEG